MKGTQIQFLVGKLKSGMPLGAVKKKKKKAVVLSAERSYGSLDFIMIYYNLTRF